MRNAPFSPLVPGGDALMNAAAAPDRLRLRMAQIYGAEPECVLPVRGGWHGIELALRAVAGEAVAFAAPPSAEMDRLASITRLVRGDAVQAGSGALVLQSPDWRTGKALPPEAIVRRAQQIAPALCVVDESYIEFAGIESAAGSIGTAENLVVIRSLSFAYGLAGAPAAAVIAAPATLRRLAQMCEPDALPTPVVRLAESVLAPERAPAQVRRIAEIKAERDRLVAALRGAANVAALDAADAPFVLLTLRDAKSARAQIAKFAVSGEWLDDARFRLDLRDRAANDQALAAFGITETGRAPRRGESVRETLETRIVAQVDLDAPRAPEISTGVGFYDHMLTQIAHHGGFGLTLTCEGDLEVDAHHTIEDCALAFGLALKQALGDGRGMARFGFVLPMDEAEAKVSVDLGGRPYLVFDGAFEAPLIGAYPTEMTEHVFRSLSQSMGAAIHVAVSGENDHHKTEACFKAFGRALRQAVRMESDAMPSTKGVI